MEGTFFDAFQLTERHQKRRISVLVILFCATLGVSPNLIIIKLIQKLLHESHEVEI